MNYQIFASFREFFIMHLSLIKAIYIIDILLLLGTSWYLFTPVSTGIYPFRTIVLLFLFLLCIIGFHVRIITSHIGSIGFYRLLPVHRFSFYAASHFVLLLPFSVILFSIALLPISTAVVSEKLLKAFQIFAVFCTIKLLTLPVLLLLKRSLFLLPLLFLMIIPVALFISAGNECIWRSFPLAGAWDMGIYSLLLFILETIIIKFVKVS